GGRAFTPRGRVSGAPSEVRVAEAGEVGDGEGAAVVAVGREVAGEVQVAEASEVGHGELAVAGAVGDARGRLDGDGVHQAEDDVLVGWPDVQVEAVEGGPAQGDLVVVQAEGDDQ